MSVRLYVEGGGDHNKALQTLCRRGFSEFIRKSGLGGRMPRVIACGGRQQAFESFRTAHDDGGMTSLPVLLVDGESAVNAANPWEHVRHRIGDEWERPPGATEDQLQLMVQTMEAWFHADREELQAFYGNGFRAGALSARAEVEMIPKADLFSGLRAATRDCQKGEYSKGAHSFQILARINPAKVRTRRCGATDCCARSTDCVNRAKSQLLKFRISRCGGTAECPPTRPDGTRVSAGRSGHY